MSSINHQTHFGNVLPESVRKFEFSWRGETTLSDIGRYKAVLALAYGEDARKFATSTVYFYVIPLKALVIVLGSLIAIIALMTWAIKAYVRRMLALAGVNPDYRASSRPVNTYRRDGDVRIERRVSLQAPVQSGVLDLKKRLEGAHAMKDVISSVYSFIIAYRVFFLIFVLCVISIFAIFFFVREVTQEQRDYEVVIENTDADVTLSSEEIIYEKSETESVALNQDSQQYSLVLINASDTPGLGASLQGRLESEGYVITSLRADLEEVKERTVIVYDTELQEEALALSKLLKNALLSANTEIPQTTPQINVFIGNDLAF